MAGGVSLSGFLPGDDVEGLTALADRLIKAWETAKRRGGDAGNATEVVVVGVLRGASLKEYRDQEARPPVLELRFAAIEPVVQVGQIDQLTSLLRHLAEDRQQLMPIPGVDDEPGMPDPNNVQEPDRPKRPKRPRGGLHSVDGDGGEEQ